MRILYLCLACLLAPIAFGVVLWRGLRDPAYRDGRLERFGLGAPLPAGGIWVHAVSVGEVQAAAPVVRALAGRYPGRALLVTTATPTGRARARALFGATVEVRYLPYDLPGSVARFLGRVRPSLAVILETELWPQLYAGCRARGIPLVLASARLSPRSVARYRRFGRFVREVLAVPAAIGAQSEEDAARFLTLGADPARVRVIGNLKFDFDSPAEVVARGQAERVRFGAGRPVWVAGSTHEGEEEILIAAHARLRERCPDALLVLAPRHPPRFAAVAESLRRRGLAFARRSAGEAVTEETSVLLLDTLGELSMFYAAGDLAFVGGSLVPIGGHNLLEPAALGKPIVTGPFNGNGLAVLRLLEAASAVEVVAEEAALANWLLARVADPAGSAVIGERGRAAIAGSRGALGRLMALIDAAGGGAPVT